MKVSDVIHGRVTTADLRRVEGDRFPAGLTLNSEVFLHCDDFGEFQLRIGKKVWAVEGTAPRDRVVLRQIGTRDLPRLVWLVQAARDSVPPQNLIVKFHEFPSACVWDEPVDIGINDRAVEDVRKRLRRHISSNEVVKFLDDRILLPPRSQAASARVLLSGIFAMDSSAKIAFRLYGKQGYAVDVERKPNGHLQVTRFVTVQQAREGDERWPIHLVTGQIKFCDQTVARQFRGIAQTELDSLVAHTDSYLALWKEYNSREYKAILERAQQFKWVRYSDWTLSSDGTWRFYVDVAERDIPDLWRRLDAVKDDQLQVKDEAPEIIVGGSDYVRTRNKSHRPFTGKLEGRDSSIPSLNLSLDHAHKLPKKGFIFVCLDGDRVLIERRNKAWEQIRSCENPMPQLGLLIEGQSVPMRHGRRLKPFTKSVRDVFESPNRRQRDALDIALNTPDIALIQGPPGTGKTRLIAALQARLAEKDEIIDTHGLRGNTLLTSFQHDAVENAAAATLVMGVPAVKVDPRGVEDGQDGVEMWCRETARKVRAARGKTIESSVHTALREVREIYLNASKRRDNPAGVLRRVLAKASPWLPTTLTTDTMQLCTELSTPQSIQPNTYERNFALKAVRELRAEAAPFADDGPGNAYKVLRRLNQLEDFTLTDAEEASLEQAISCSPGVPADKGLLVQLQQTKDALINRLQNTEINRITPRVHVDVENMVVRVIDVLTERVRETAPGAEFAISEWLNNLDNNPKGMLATLKQYSMVLAATCQHSVSNKMRSEKSENDLVFRTVIVDEAARANPLDLLIPMALAEQRIVLVGDHRQLPHILDPDIEREIEKSVQEETHAALRNSLFERLFTKLREQEKRDGVVRTVTLNQQYRMHPILGQFVSQQFYEPYEEGFKSGREDKDFAHAVSLQCGESLAGKVAAWIDVPLAHERESGGRSKQRPAEAQRIAKEAHTVLSQFPELSVGVVAFYTAQRDRIWDSMCHAGLAERNESGFYIREHWQRTNDGRERLRIGTVDAFQGKEFDIVFLSLTRSNEVQVTNEATRRRKYGFLLLENRLCVAMSRQHKLLIVVGDSAMASGPKAVESVPGLCAFKELCEGPSGSIIRI